jgi:Ca-activated chloride channel family protein
MQLESPWSLALLLLLPLLGYLMLRRKGTAAVKFSSVSNLRACPVSWRQRLRPALTLLRLGCLALLIVALARPRKGTVLSEISTEGVAIEVVVDRSGSMQAEMDYKGQKMNRLDAVKKVFADFIAGGDGKMKGRSGDLLGLVTFAGYADTVCPLVLSHDVLIQFLEKTNIVTIRSEDGTAIGDAIALAAARLKKAEDELTQRSKRLGLDLMDPNGGGGPNFKIKSKAIILLTDGRQNAGELNALEAAKLAKEWGIKIYTIGIGSGQSFMTIQTMMGTMRVPTSDDLDERLLRAVAETTGGFYGRADDAEALRDIVQKIDELEKTKVRTIQYAQFTERFGSWTLAALLLLACEMLASCTILRKIP